MRVLILGCVLSIASAGAGCDEVVVTDARYSTPEHTVETLFAAYGLGDASADALRERLAARVSFELQDHDAHRACFADHDGDALSDGMAGWVFGALAAGRDALRTEMFADRATVSPREGVRVVLRHGEDGAWRIVLRESVPDRVREGLAALAERHEQRVRGSAPR